MSRRKRRAGATAATESGRERALAGKRAAGGAGAPRARAAPAPSRGLAVDVAVVIAVFAVTVGIAELAGAANLGVALGTGQVAFAITLMVVLLRG